jgi:hypothetical protein
VTPGDGGRLAEALQSMVESIPSALAASGRPVLPLDRGATSVRRFDKLVAAHVRSFSFDRLSRQVVAGIRALAP